MRTHSAGRRNDTVPENNRLDGTKHLAPHVPEWNFLSLHQSTDSQMGADEPFQFIDSHLWRRLRDDRDESGSMYTPYICVQYVYSPAGRQTKNNGAAFKKLNLNTWESLLVRGGKKIN